MGVDFRFIHVSDLHFGDSLFTPWWAFTSWIPGLETHDTRVASELSNSLRSIALIDPVPNEVVATGDLTTWGRPPAFSIAFTYLRHCHFVGGNQEWMGLRAPNAAIVPGNHDIWSGAILGISSIANTPPSTRPEFLQFFGHSAPGGTHSSGGLLFPYRIPFTCGASSSSTYSIYLYGLDSTRVDLLSNPKANNFRAEGFVDPQQLTHLQSLVSSEPAGPHIRIAAIHHPLAYPDTLGTPAWKTLVNLDTEVLPALQQLGFGVVLCGHEHTGFARWNGAPNSPHPQILILSAGTATQTVRLSKREKQLVGLTADALSSNDARDREKAANRCNEYRIYDFEFDQKNGKQLKLTVRPYRYDPNLYAFARLSSTEYWLPLS